MDFNLWFDLYTSITNIGWCAAGYKNQWTPFHSQRLPYKEVKWKKKVWELFILHPWECHSICLLYVLCRKGCKPEPCLHEEDCARCELKSECSTLPWNYILQNLCIHPPSRMLFMIFFNRTRENMRGDWWVTLFHDFPWWIESLQGFFAWCL